MKKERIILFPENESGKEEGSAIYINSIRNFRTGKSYRIGQPSSKNYQYIHPVIETRGMSVNDFEDFRIIEGMIITVTSILRMVNGSRIAVLRNFHDKPFLKNYEKVFAHIDMSISTHEIIPLDIETERALELAVITK